MMIYPLEDVIGLITLPGPDDVRIVDISRRNLGVFKKCALKLKAVDDVSNFVLHKS
jgi:hypothetical protein